MTSYARHFKAIARARDSIAKAEAIARKAEYTMRGQAIEEANASLIKAGIVAKETLLTLKGRWEYQNKPILIRFVTCWSAPHQTPLRPSWQMQMHYEFARKDGQPNRARNADYHNIACKSPADFGAAVLERFPPWTK